VGTKVLSWSLTGSLTGIFALVDHARRRWDTTMKENLECYGREDRGIIASKAARESDTRSSEMRSRLNGDDTSPLYKCRCFTASQV
jgi:hypothetical protein